MKTLRLSVPLVFLLGIGCWNRPGTDEVKGTATPGKPAEVKLISPVKKSLVRSILQPAQILPFEEAILHSKVTGNVKQVLVDIGDQVKGPVFDEKGILVREGTLLLTIDVPELLQEWEQKKAGEKLAQEEVQLKKDQEKVHRALLDSAKAVLEESRAGILRVDAAFERWKIEYDRISKLVSGKVLDEQTGDEAKNQLKSAESSRVETTARVKQAEAKKSQAEAELEQAGSEVRVALARLQVAVADTKRMAALASYTRIHAPFDGVITSRKVDPGKLVHEDSASKGEPLFTISKLDPVRVVIEVPETDSLLVNAGSEAHLSLHALPGKAVTGKVSRISWALDQSSRTLRAEVDLGNSTREFRPGMFANARILAPLAESFVLPTAALVRSPEGNFAFMVEGGKAKRVEVRLGRVEGESAQVSAMKTDVLAEWQEITGEMSFIGSGAAAIAPGQAVVVK